MPSPPSAPPSRRSRRPLRRQRLFRSPARSGRPAEVAALIGEDRASTASCCVWRWPSRHPGIPTTRGTPLSSRALRRRPKARRRATSARRRASARARGGRNGAWARASRTSRCSASLGRHACAWQRRWRPVDRRPRRPSLTWIARTGIEDVALQALRRALREAADEHLGRLPLALLWLAATPAGRTSRAMPT